MNDAKLRAALAKYLRLPAPAVAKMQISPPGPVVSARQLNDWIGMMNGQAMLQTAPIAAQLIVK